MSTTGFYYSFTDHGVRAVNDDNAPAPHPDGFVSYLSHLAASRESELSNLTDAQWDVASGESYYLGSREISLYQNANDFTFEVWQAWVDDKAEGAQSRVGEDADLISTLNEAISGPTRWGNNLGSAEYEGSEQMLTTYFDFGVRRELSAIDPLSASQLSAIQRVSQNLELAVSRLENGSEEGSSVATWSEGYSAGYGLDQGYYYAAQNGVNYFHSGLDIAGDRGDKLRSPITGEVIDIEYVAGSEFNRIMILDDVTGLVWSFGHVDATLNLRNLFDLRGAVPLRVESGTVIGELADFRDINGVRGNNNGDHVHIEVQHFSQGVSGGASPDGARFNNWEWDSEHAGGWGRYTNLGNALDKTVSPLQAYFEYDADAALSEISTASASNVTYSTEADLSARGAGQSPENSITTAMVVAPTIVTSLQESEVAITALNYGPNTLDGTGTFFAILSNDATLSSDDLVIGRGSHSDELTSGLSYTSVLTVDWSQAPNAGDYFLFAGYFHPDDVTLSDRYLVREVEIREQSITNLSIQNATIQQTSFLAGESLSLSVLVQNLGDRTSGTSELIVEVRNGGGWEQIGSASVVSLPGGTRTVDTVRGTIPEDYDGNLDIRVRLENDRDVDNDNNVVRFDTVSVVQPARPEVLPTPELDPDTNINSRIDSASETETYNFTTTEGGLHRLTFSQPEYLRLKIYDQEGRQLATYRLDRVRYDDTEFMFQAPEAGTYTVEISSNGVYTGDYSLSISDDLQNTAFRYSEDQDFVYSSRYIDATYELLNGDDVFDGQSGVDKVYGRGGDDRIETGGGNDTLYGGSGRDNLFGQSGNDVLHGGDDRDYLDGGSGNDLIYGNSGNDFFVFLGDGNDTAYGGTGDDTFNRENASGRVTIVGGDGQDQINYQGFSEQIIVDLVAGTFQGPGLQHDSIQGVENISGSDGNDILSGNEVGNLFFGGNGDDSLYGLGGEDRLLGKNGNDYLYGGEGDDYLSPGAGVDQVYAGDGDDEVYVKTIDGDVLRGESGSDTLKLKFTSNELSYVVSPESEVIFSDAGGNSITVTGFEIFKFEDVTLLLGDLLSETEDQAPTITTDSSSAGTEKADWIWGRDIDDVVRGLGGDDVIQTFDGDDKVYSGKGRDLVELGDGDDYVRVGGGIEEFHGGDGKDYISYYDSSNGVNINLATNEVSGSWASNDTISGFESVSGSKTGDDRIYGTSGSNTIRTYGGDDRVYAGKGTDKVYLGDGNDYVKAGGGREEFHGGSGKDYISYYDSSNGVNINLATNEVSGSWASNDTISGFESVSGSKTGDDRIYGTSGSNTIKTYGGDDRVYAGKGTDRIELGSGNDYVKVGGGKEYFDGGSGKDYISYYDSTGGIRIDLEADSVSGSWAVNDTIKNFESASGSKTGADTMLGTSGSNTLKSYGGDDKLYGRSGDDKLYGGDGEDRFDGGAGTDLLYGGADADTFHFDHGEDHDVIKDFENNVDMIELDNFGFASKDEAFSFATQSGDDVVFDFGDGDMLTVENATIGQLQNDLEIV